MCAVVSHDGRVGWWAAHHHHGEEHRNMVHCGATKAVSPATGTFQLHCNSKEHIVSVVCL